jgi:hypothetical protein
VKEPNPDFEFYQGYGNMEKLGAVPLLEPERFVEVVMDKLNAYASEYVRAYNFLAEPKRKGDPPTVFDGVEAYVEMIKATPDDMSDDSDEEKDAEKQAWRATIEARLSAIEKQLGLVSLAAEPDAPK